MKNKVGRKQETTFTFTDDLKAWARGMALEEYKLSLKKELKEVELIDKMLNCMPYEVVVQFSDMTDLHSVLLEKAIEESEKDDVTVLDEFKYYAELTLETYDDYILGHINYELKEEDPELWRKEKNEIKRYIKKLEGYLG